MAISTKSKAKIRRQRNRDIILSDKGISEAVARALDDIELSLKNEDYDMVLLSLGRNFDQPQIAIKVGERKWINVEGTCILDCLLQYASKLGESDAGE